MGFIKRIFQLSLSKREIVRSKRFMAILMIPIFVIQMSSLNLFLMQAVIAEDGESDVVAESEEIKEAPPEEESAPDEIEKSDPPKEEVKPINVEEVSKESPADEDALVALEEIIPNSISEVIDEVKEEIPPVVAPEIIQEEAVENDEGGRITPEAAYDENLEVSAPAPVVQEPRIEEGWKENADGSSSITVKAGNEYEFKDSGLKIKFTRIDNGTGEITVKEIELTPEQVTISGALSNKAWDITSDMVDGTFEYVLTLPVEENTKLENAEIIYVENKEDLSDKDKIKTVKEEDVKVDEEKDEVVAEKLDHFTIYIVSKTVKLFGQVNGSSQVTVTPGEMITVTMEVQLSGNEPNDWLSSRYQIEGGIQTCVNTPDHIDSGTYTESFDITAPTNLGTYDLTLRAYDQSGCPSGGKRDEEIMQNAIIVVATTPFANPALPESCGLDIALVLDNSTSIDSGELSTMKSAMISFVNALAGTPTQFSVTRFATTASVVQNFTSDTAAVISAINSIPVGGGYTNWEDGLLEAQSTLSNRSEIFDLVIFASDGNPNRVDNGTSVDESQAVSEAVLVANDIKSNGARILALGIGNGLDTANLIALSGPVVNASDIADSDVVTSNFPDLANDLGAFASATCGGTISVNKYYDQVDEVHRGGSGWIFDVAGTSKTTDSNGQTESVKVDAGTYSVTETSLLSGYTYDSASCYKVASPSHIEIGEDITNGVGNIPVGNSDIVYCNFVNTTNKGSITITKDAVPNDAQDFSFTTTGTGLSSFSLDDDSDATLSNTKVFNNLMPGTFSISENSVNDWNLDDISCTGASDFSKDINSRSVTINLKPGENITCTFTNKIQTGTLIVKKVVTNDNGGMKIASDFTFSVDGGSAVAFEADGQNELTVSAGTYSITEPAVSGYATTYENCTNIAVPNGGSATCTIKNDDIAPTLSVVKKVINDNGGNETVDAFEIKMNDNLLSFGAGVPSGDTTTYTANPTVTANASYALSEKDLAGYTEGTWNCKTVAGAPVAYPVTLAEGQNVICEISNDDIAPTITLIKEVINNNGGQAGVNDFGLSIGGAIVSSGQVYSVEANTAYALNEIGLSGYEFVSITGDAKCPIALGGTATLNEGENITCTIKNDDQSPKLHLRKIVTSNNGGTATAADFTLTADGSGLNDISGTSPVDSDGTLQADTFILSETGPAGYLGGEWVCSGDGRQSGASITLGLGEEATCTITNDDQAAHLKLIKKVINDNDGKAVAEDFTLSASGPTPLTGDGVVESDVNAGKYTLSETTNLTGYEAGDWSCTNGVIVNENKEITLALGQSTVCSITNDDIQPKLTVTKVVNNSNYGNLAVADFPLYVGATSVISGVQNKFNVGSYIISETGKPGYSAEISGDCDPNGNVTLTPGDVKSCTITNTDNLGKIIIEKQTLPDGDTQMFTFNGDISGSIADDGKLEKIVAPGNYSVSEVVPSGWDLTSLICDDENSGASVVAGATANINMEANETVKCTFTNTKRGLITVAKDAINNDAQDFEFTNNFSNDNPAIFYLDDDSNGALPKLRTFEVLPGEYWVSEEAVAGWQQESATCDNGDTIDSINVEPGENITCEFVNEKYAKIILVKNTIGGDDTFDFDAMGDGLPVDIDLTTANGTASQAFENLDQDNTYSIAENVPTNWNLTSAICTGDGNTPDKITPEPGETVTCTFTNTKKSNLTVVKKVINDNGGIKTVDDFGINFSGGALNFDAGVSLGSTTTYTSQTLTVNPGSHNLFENDVFGYTEGVWDCGAVGAGGISTVVSLAPGENKTCTIINDDVAPTITLNKNVTGGIAGVNEFGLTIGDVAVNSGVKTNVSANTPIALNEVGLAGYTFTSITGDEDCPNVLGGEVTLEEGDDLVCTINNTRDTGSITVNKIIDMDGNLETVEDQVSGVNWEFDVDPYTKDTTDAPVGLTDSQGRILFPNLNTGYYSVIETMQTGYDLVKAECDVEYSQFNQEDRIVNVSVAKEGNTTCNFYNVPNGTIHGYKWEDLNGNGERDCKNIEEGGGEFRSNICEKESLLANWTINLYQSNGEGGFGSEPIRTMVTDSGSEHFGWYWFEHLLPGQYKVCEVLEDSWTQTYPNNDGGNCHIVNLPDDNSNGFNESLNAVWGPEYNFGNFELGRIKACKYEDMNGNGQKDAEDFPLKNIDIQLYDYPDDWRLSDTKSTGEDGCVIFEDLQVGKYKVEEDVDDPDLSGYYQSFFPQSFEYEIISGSDENNAVFLNSKYRTISGYKFNDLNSNGIWEELEGETPLGGWTIYLDGNFNKVYDLGETSTTTDANGYYEFTDLVSDSYRVGEFLSPIQAADGWVQTTPVSGFYDLDLHSVIISMGNNFGNVQLSDIHGYKWSDLNGNGERDCIEEGGEDFRSEVFDDSEMYQCELEPLLSGWTINLYKSNGEGGFGSEPIRTTVTDSSSEHFGWYWFEDLPLGDYKVCEVLQNDWRQTHPLNSDDNCHLISLPSGKSNGFDLPAMLNAVGGPVYSFGNQQLARITVVKFEDLNGDGQKDEGEDTLSGWEINLSGQDSINTNENGEVMFDKLLPESYELSETLQPGWNQTNIYCEDNNGPGAKITSEGEAYGHHGNCEGWNQCGDAETCAQWACRVRGYSSLVSYGESRPCTQFNNCHLFQHSVISTPPILSINPSYQDNEYIDYDWGNSCDVMGVTDIICNNPGFSEAAILSEDDSESDLVSENNYRLALNAGDSKTCYVGNQFVAPELTILKYNNQWPTVQSPGSVIDYTIKVEAQKNNVKGVVVTDLPPEGFKYISGSWSATSSLGGGHDGKLELSHEYASPGEWDLGDMQAGEVITLSYRAQIDGAQQPGLYNDLAWADGTDNRSARVLATSMPAPAVDPGEITDNFVGTQIELAVAPLPQNVELEEDKETETKTKKKVLGVTTYLPATGTPTMWIILAILILIAGISLMIFARRRNDKIKNMKDKTLMLAVIVTGMMFLGADAQAMAPAIRLAQPTTPTEIKNQNIAFTVLDIDNRLVTVDCYKKGPADSDWVKFSTVGLPSGGSSGVCAINLDIDGGYDFYTEATAGGEVSKSKTVSLVLNTAVPGTPRKYNRNGGSCSVSFTTADDGGLTGKVVMYRSKNTEFVADNSTKVQEGNFGSNIEGVLTDPNDNCDDYYYAIQAVSEGGIGSDFTGDEDVDVETRTRTRTVYEENIVYTGGGAIPVEETEGTITEEAGATATEGGVTEEGTVQGEATEGALSEGAETEQGKVAGMFSEKNSKYGWVLVGLAVLGATYYVMRRRAKKKSELPLDEN